MVKTLKVKSMIDDDMYKCTMQQAILKLYPNAIANYRFTNRGTQRFSPNFLERLRDSVSAMSDLCLSPSEKDWLGGFDFFNSGYINYLSSYRYNPDEVNLDLDSENNLVLEIEGPWHSTVLWEVKLMALISELFFMYEDTHWDKSETDKIFLKRGYLNKCVYADFGTRRRRSFDVHDFIVSALANSKGFVGTSNLYLAYKYGLKPIGTMAHEWIQAISALESMNHPNRFMLQKWADVYEGSLGIALPDTFGSNSFFKDFNKRYSKLFDGVRHDSGNPFKFADKTIAHYKSLGIDPLSKTIVFSDSLNPYTAFELHIYCKNKIKCSFGIGTNFTNDFSDSPSLNMVIKLVKMNNNHVVKLSDDYGKANGDPGMIEIMKKIHMK